MHFFIISIIILSILSILLLKAYFESKNSLQEDLSLDVAASERRELKSESFESKASQKALFDENLPKASQIPKEVNEEGKNGAELQVPRLGIDKRTQKKNILPPSKTASQKNKNVTRRPARKPIKKQVGKTPPGNFLLGGAKRRPEVSEIVYDTIEENKMLLMSAEGYFDLGMYPEAWLSACRCVANSYQRDAVKLQLRICAASFKWKLGDQIAQEYESRVGCEEFLAAFYISKAKACYADGDIFSARHSIQKAYDCSKVGTSNVLDNDENLRKIFNIRFQS